MNDAVVEAIKIAGYRAAGIEGKIVAGIPDPAIYIQRALELLEDYDKTGRKYEIDLNKLAGEMNGFIGKMIKKYHPDVDYETAIRNASKAAFITYGELHKLHASAKLV